MTELKDLPTQWNQKVRLLDASGKQLTEITLPPNTNTPPLIITGGKNYAPVEGQNAYKETTEVINPLPAGVLRITVKDV